MLIIEVNIGCFFVSRNVPSCTPCLEHRYSMDRVWIEYG